MREDASKAATESVGLLKDGDDIASLRRDPAAYPPRRVLRAQPPSETLQASCRYDPRASRTILSRD